MSTQTLSLLFRSGFSRIPVYGRDRNDIVGLILTKDLICLGHMSGVSVMSFLTIFQRPIICVWSDDKLPDVSLYQMYSSVYLESTVREAV
jgi:metal transporter CNNM